MQVSKAKDARPERVTSDLFMGEVHRHPMVETGTERLRIGLVKFSPGGRTKWHTHTFEQGLVILEGKGIVATEAQEHVVEPGDVIVIPTNEKHWHGGTETTAMAHLSIGAPDGKTTTLEPVDKIRTQNP